MTIKLENLQDGYDHLQLNLGELHLLLSLAKITASPQSPLNQLMPVGKAGTDADLMAGLGHKGLLSKANPPELVEAVRQALETAARPAWTIALRAGDSEGITGATFLSPDDHLDHSLVRFRQQGDQDVSLSYFLSKEHVLSLLEPYLRFTALSGGPGLNFSLTLNEYMVLMAVADAFRQTHLEALLGRQIIENWRVSIEELESALDKGAAFIDPRWLVSVAHLCIPTPYQWPREAVQAGTEGLVAKALLKPAKDGSFPRYRLSRQLEILCSALMGITGFGALRVDRQISGQERGVVCLGLMRTPETIWVSGYNHLDRPEPGVTLFSADGFFVAQALTELMERSARLPVTARDQGDADTSACDACGAAIAPQSKFCSGCGRPVTAPPESKPQQFCSQCGTRLRPDVKFCTSCGTLIH